MALCEKAKQATSNPYPTSLLGMVIKLPTLKNSESSLYLMGIKPAFVMASLWEGQISDRTISRALKKIGFTRKKRPTATVSAPEDKRQAFVAQLSSISVEKIVYLDESGMDNREDYEYGWT